MKNKIVILSPGEGCKRTGRIIRQLESLLEKNKVDYEMKIEYNRESFAIYNTWILPTIIINDRVVSRGYCPSEIALLKHLN